MPAPGEVVDAWEIRVVPGFRVDIIVCAAGCGVGKRLEAGFTTKVAVEAPLTGLKLGTAGLLTTVGPGALITMALLRPGAPDTPGADTTVAAAGWAGEPWLTPPSIEARV